MVSFALYLQSSFRAKPRNVSVQGCGTELFGLISPVIVLRIICTHTPLRSYLSTPLRSGRDDGWDLETERRARPQIRRRLVRRDLVH
jgi:hypothetical protein